MLMFKSIFYRGQSSSNSSLIGWGGHFAPGTHQNVTEMLEKAVIDYKIEDLVKLIKIETMSRERVSVIAKDNLVKKGINYPGNCYTLDVTRLQDVVEKGITRILIKFVDNTSVSVEVYLLGKTLDSRRNLRSNTFYTQGLPIRPKHRIWSSYIVKTQEVVYVEEDQSKECRNYPNREFLSFGECDDQGAKNFLAKHFPNIIPVWLTDNMASVTTRAVIEKGKRQLNPLKKNLQVDWRNTSVWSLKYLSVLPPFVHRLASELQK